MVPVTESCMRPILFLLAAVVLGGCTSSTAPQAKPCTASASRTWWPILAGKDTVGWLQVDVRSCTVR